VWNTIIIIFIYLVKNITELLTHIVHYGWLPAELQNADALLQPAAGVKVLINIRFQIIQCL
jgi:hypothetical protein